MTRDAATGVDSSGARSNEGADSVAANRRGSIRNPHETSEEAKAALLARNTDWTLPTMSTPNDVKHDFCAGTFAGNARKSAGSHKVAESVNGTMCLHSNRPRTVAAAGGATQEVESPMPPKSATCPYCGRRVASNRRPHIVRGYFANGDDFVGHRSCFMEMRHPDDPRYGHSRWDIKEGR